MVMDRMRTTPRILLIEDNPDDVFFLQTVLARGETPKELDIVSDGEAALRFLRREPPFESAVRPHLILLDLKLPKLSGIEVLRQIKSDEELRRIPVIVLTTSGAADEMNATYDLLATSFIRKPESLEAFARVVEGIDRFWFEVVKLPMR
jgi:two-component system, chemotaxis family, response regulator Rcp1